MNELANELENKGFNAEIKGNKVNIRLGGLTNPVSVAHDLQKASMLLELETYL
ncbi:hypothetical protein [Veronia nyctiphanis]|uniref:hypothetical protein n=1 Tax=Veronia nyctiphanis TaxID=1278244 RepID=UPI001375F291|nr:hypothetical protein [Veronia nyctiphanis]